MSCSSLRGSDHKRLRINLAAVSATLNLVYGLDKVISETATFQLNPAINGS